MEGVRVPSLPPGPEVLIQAPMSWRGPATQMCLLLRASPICQGKNAEARGAVAAGGVSGIEMVGERIRGTSLSHLPPIPSSPIAHVAPP